MRKTKPKLGRGIYLRGRTYWLSVQKNGSRSWTTLETSDPSEAIRQSETIRQNLILESGSPLNAEITRFIAYKTRQQEYTRSTAVTKRNKLLLVT